VPSRNLPAVVIWMFGALLSFSVAAVAIRGLSRTMSTFELLALRNIGGIALLAAAALAVPRLRSGFRPGNLPLQAARNGIHFGATALWAYSLTILPLATAFALEFTAPLWVTVFAVLMLGEKLTRPRVVAAVLGFAGVLVILRPGSSSLQFGSVLMLVAATGFALTSIVTKKLTGLVSTFSILFWMNVLQLGMNIVAIVALNAHLDVWNRLEASQIPAAIGLIVGGFMSHLCLTNAFRNGDATLVIPLDFLRIPLIAVVGWWLYGEPLDAAVFGGALLIIVGVLWNLRAEARRVPGAVAGME